MRILSLCLIFLLVSCKTTYRRTDISSIPEAEKQKVYNFGKRIFETCKTRQFIQVTGREATQGLAELSLEEMQHACDALDKSNGKFIDMNLVEVIDDTFAGNSKIYRYKANFERNEFLKEIRIWLRTDGKFQGIIIQEWKDEYTPYKK
ncbi:MAG: hypothetical protein ABIQ27_14085 [Flavobacterium sp.]|uniref:hypothetical protein n=1 Tax=Flavobacterium sp. TaxID=239 RepID=UPI0032653560